MSLVRRRFKPRLLVVYGLGVLLILYARPSSGSLALGLVPIALGEGLRLWATGHLHKNDALTVSGPYAYLRHPLYLGSLLIAGGLAIISATPLAWGVLGVFALGYFSYYMPYKNRIESARLEALYGDAYRRYAVVPSLIPRLYAYVPLASDAGPLPDFRARFRDNHELGTACVVFGIVGILVVRWALL